MPQAKTLVVLIPTVTTLALLPVLPRTPINRFSPEEIVKEVPGHADQVTSITLFRPVGVGKSSTTFALLYHSRTQVKLGRSRHFMRCENLTGAASPNTGSPTRGRDMAGA